MKLTVEFQDATGTYHGRYVLKDESGLFVCGITGTDEATAKQLAAAPQLLAECKKQIVWLRHVRQRGGGLTVGFEQAIKYLTEAVQAATE